MQDIIDTMDLIRYDPERGVFVLKAQPQVEFWPGTNIKKSKHNAFNWKGQSSKLTKYLQPANVNPNPVRPRGTFTIYAKARKMK